MPRYYRKRYTRVIKPKKKWATNITDLSDGVPTVVNNTCLLRRQLAVNSNPVSIPTPVIVKTGNFKLQCDATFALSGNSQVQFLVYIMYVPEGFSVSDYASAKAYIDRHPEWIMAWKFGSIDYIVGNGNIDSVKVSSRLKRNLNSGDSIYFFGLAETATGVTFNSAHIGGMCQYWTCAN